MKKEQIKPQPKSNQQETKQNTNKNKKAPTNTHTKGSASFLKVVLCTSPGTLFYFVFIHLLKIYFLYFPFLHTLPVVMPMKYVCVCARACVPRACESQKRVLDRMELELQMFVSCHVGVGNQTCVFWKSSQCS
jgi:hypothetical protein